MVQTLQSVEKSRNDFHLKIGAVYINSWYYAVVDPGVLGGPVPPSHQRDGFSYATL